MTFPNNQAMRNFQSSFFARFRNCAAHLAVKPERADAVFVFALFAAGFLIRLWGMSKNHSWDEMVYLQNAKVICCGKINYSELDFRPPLLSLIFAGVFLVWQHVFATSIVTACMNALGPIFLFFAGRSSVGRLPATLASLLLAFSPFIVGVFPQGFVSDDTGNSLLTDSPALTLVLLSLWLLLRALERPTVYRLFGAGFALALCILMRFGSIPSVGILLLLPLMAGNRWKAIIVCVFGMATGIGPYLFWSKLRYGELLFTLRAGWANVEGPTEPFTFFLRNAPTIFTPVAVIGLMLFLFYQLSHLGRAIYGFHDARTHAASTLNQRFFNAYLWLWLLAGLVFFSLMPHKEPRYILPLAPPVLLLASSGLCLFTILPNKTLRVAGAVLLGIVLLITFLPLRERISKRFVNTASTDQELASRFLESSVPADTTLYMSFNYPAFAYYTNFRIHELSSVGPALYRDMSKIPPGEILVVYREAEDASQSDVAWVDANRKFKRLRDYPSLVIFRSVDAPEPAGR
jgi:4-amino-4-deoxy-L-arabinose transferase-like glycosyltransferase